MKENKLLKSFLGFAIGPMGAALINFITIPITTWLISPEEFGKTSLFMLMQTLATAFIFLGMDQAYVREYNTTHDKKKLLFNALILPIIFAVFSSVAMVCILNTSVVNHYNDMKILALLFLLWLPFITIERFLLLEIRMQERGLIYSFFNILVKLLVMVFTVVLLTLWEKSYLMVILANVVAQIITDITLILYSRKSINFKIKYLDFRMILKMTKFGLPFIPTSLIMWLLTSTDRLALEKYVTKEEIGIYFAALKVIGVFTIFQTIFATFWLPVAYRWKKEKVQNFRFNEVSHALSFIMSVVFLGILLFKELFVIILSQKYSEIMFIVPFLLFYPIMYTLAETTGLGIAFARKTYFNIVISAISAAFNLVMNFVLVPNYGPLGASIATGCTFIIYFWLKTLISRKLWYKFDLKYYLILTGYLVVAATLNVIISSKSIYFINVLLILILVLCHKQLIQQHFQSIKIKKIS